MHDLATMVSVIAIILACVALLLGRFKSWVYVGTLMFIATWLLVIPQLPSQYVYGIDAHWERVIAVATLSTGVWNPSLPGNLVNGALSIAILEPAVAMTGGLPVDIVSKFIYSFYGVAAVPFVWRIARRLLGLSEKEAFLTTALLVGTGSYMLFSGYARQELATFVSVLLVYFLLSSGRRLRSRTSLSASTILLAAGVVLSHYATALILLSVFALAGLVVVLKNRKADGVPFLTLFAAMMFAWVLYVAAVLLSTVSGLARVASAVSQFATDRVSNVVQQQLNPTSNDAFGLLNYALNLCIVAFLAIGTATFLRRIWRNLATGDVAPLRYGVFSFLLIVLILASLLPGVSLVYNAERIYLTALFFAVGFVIVGLRHLVIGFRSMGGWLTKAGPPTGDGGRQVLALATVLVLAHLAMQVGLPAQLLTGSGRTVYFEEAAQDLHYTLPAEVAGVSWIATYLSGNCSVFTDFYGRGYLPLQSYGRLPPTRVATVTNAADLDPHSCNLFYRQKQGVAASDPIFASERLKIQANVAYLQSKDKIYDAGDVATFAF